MAFTRSTIIDASPSGDSVKQAVLDLDADLTGAFAGLNQVQAATALKISQSEYDQPSGVPRLDAAGRIKAAQIPDAGADLPVGMIAAFGMESLSEDANWLECDGAQLPLADYAALHAAIGDAFGLADPGFFRLPDLRGRFLRGFDNGAGHDPDVARRSGGDAVGSTQNSATLDHAHPLFTGGAGWGVGTENGGFGIPTVVSGTAQSTAGLLSSAEGGMFYPAGQGSGWHLAQISPWETRPFNVAVLWAIKWR
ncbi:hypothetical protein NNJEOMEG_03883 [Fundidesulfovibrio magnetotacticus]|uniref:Phage tail collar domain-containing protein n=1 Tax=Fundidesulfovibrio magnetotacticus TaxID=2730080 RepID=A0A6V8M1A9_9BACT|nr:phage tail protein [Fundidesulfovibrio magnetotacticus]GFK96009.1 hypothetical protein NNJEOMEG_03883 [Fundidesulfovibrio magnetotacticus]